MVVGPASTITQSPLRLLDHPLDGPPKSLMSRSTAAPHPSIIIPVWPVGTNGAARPAARSFGASRATDILPIGAQSVRRSG